MIVKSAAKLNLTLDILGLLPGGYHAIETIFQNVDLVDTLEFSFVKNKNDTELAVELILEDSTGNSQLDFPLQQDNLIAKAAKAFSKNTNLGKSLTVQVKVQKKIPIAAGLAGGSGNAAATLVALNQHFENPLSLSELSDIAATLGSDISFFIYGGTCAGTGRGEILEEVRHAMQLSFFIVKPKGISISTPWIYREYDAYTNQQPKQRATSNLVDCRSALQNGDLDLLVKSLNNCFEPVVFNAYPEVQLLRDGMLEAGCLSANISGSGPTLYGLTTSPAQSEQVQQRFLQWCAERKDLNQIKLDTWTANSLKFGTSIITHQLIQ